MNYLSVLPTAQFNLCADFLRLPHPRTGIASLFLPVELPNGTTILEVQVVSPLEPRSWFLRDEIVSDGRLLVMTPIDPVFLLLPVLEAAHSLDEGSQGQFRPADDIFEEAARKIEEESKKHNRKSHSISSRDVTRLASFQCARDSLQRLCDVKEITSDIVVYRYSNDKVLEYLQKKVVHLAASHIIEGSKTLLRSLAKDGLLEDCNEHLLEVGRIRAACEVLSQYLPTDIRNALFASYDFRKLDAHIGTLRVEVLAVTETKPDKKDSANMTKPSEEKKRKAKASQGVENLKKVNVNGMAKLSDYFTKP